jgi:prepilin-type N-terminal cleavage/methylation domain-containing protein
MKNKGFTMLELMVSLGISSLVVGLIFSFFTSNYRLYKTLRNDTELHFQAHYILNFMTGKIVDSSCMSLAKNYTGIYSMTSVRSAYTEYPVNKVSFKYGNESENYVFYITDNIIRYGKGNKDMNPTVELGNYVREMYLSVLRDESFQNAKAVKIKLVMEKGGQVYEAFQTVYMRNN